MEYSTGEKIGEYATYLRTEIKKHQLSDDESAKAKAGVLEKALERLEETFPELYLKGPGCAKTPLLA
tara:strand:- start:2191 stop:2391 length:201 start_codon:yes stop_codon:yes gene_type:complete